MTESAALATRAEAPSSALVTREYLTEKAALVRELYAKGTNDLEFEHFIETCATRGLNPLAKQIYCVMRYDKKEQRKVPTFQTGIDGFRLIAQRTGEYRGQVGPEWCGKDGQWRDVWLDTSEHPAAAKVGVLREGFSEPVWGVVTWEAYADTSSSFWSDTKGVNQLAKCAESLALRKAFPEELSGLYTTEEMGQAATAPAEHPAGSWQSRWAELQERASAEGVSVEDMKARLRYLGVSKPSDFGDDAVWDVALQAVGHAEPVVEGEVVDESAAAPDPPESPTDGDAAVAEQIPFPGPDEHQDPA